MWSSLRFFHKDSVSKICVCVCVCAPTLPPHMDTELESVKCQCNTLDNFSLVLKQECRRLATPSLHLHCFSPSVLTGNHLFSAPSDASPQRCCQISIYYRVLKKCIHKHTHNVYYYNISQVFEVMGILVQALLLLMVHISSMTNTGNHFIRYFSTFSSSGFNIQVPLILLPVLQHKAEPRLWCALKFGALLWIVFVWDLLFLTLQLHPHPHLTSTTLGETSSS